MTVKSLRRELQHITKATGLLVWPGAEILVSFIEKRPDIFQQKRVLELGCGIGLCSLACALYDADVLATDGDSQTVELARDNVELNRSLPWRSAPRTAFLRWGQNVEAFLQNECGGKPFPVVIGADITYAAALCNTMMTLTLCCLFNDRYQPDCLGPLYRTVDELLDTTPDAVFVLSYMPRVHVPISQVVEAAAAAGWEVTHVPLDSFTDATRYPAVATLMLMRRAHTHPRFTRS